MDAIDQAPVIGGGPSALARMATSEARPVKVIPFPGERGKRSATTVGLWNLTDYELRQARIDAIKYLTDTCKLTELHMALDSSFGDEEIKSQTLWRALRDSNDTRKPFANTVNEIRVHLTPDERESLFASYLEWVDERSPIQKLRSSEEVDELVTALGKGTASLASYDSASLKSIVRSLVSQVSALTKQLSSSTSPSSEDSPLSQMAPAGDSSP